ncbi:exopolysaccharide biosynthesis polyprenyl glycosylphosphotransferase [bacterium]|nr:exopolysaccharide biosynthesis polyprenyl glycosylphosphotransferase [bacterium]
MNKKTIFPLIFDLIMSILLVYFIYNIRFSFNIYPSHHIAYIILLTSPFIFIIFNLILGIYNENIIDLDTMGNLFISGIITYLLYFLILIITKTYIKNLDYSTPILIVFSIILPFFSTLVHLLFKNIFISEKIKPRLLLYGLDEKDIKFIHKYFDYLMEHYNIIGICGTQGMAALKHIQDNKDLFSILERYNIQVVLFGSELNTERMEEFIFSPSVFSLKFLFIPELYDKFTELGKVIPLSDIPLFQLDTMPIKGFSLLLQRFFDIIISLIALVLFLPFGIIIVILIGIDSQGPVFFKQIRLGKFGKPFKLIKFRSMVKNAEEVKGPQWTDKDDPRITKVGRFLRRFSIDEFPQFINVLLGKMSLVGPRPERPYFIDKYPILKGIRMLVKPGITGLAQVNGTYDLDPEEKLKFDIYLITHFNIFFYFFILIKTVLIMITGRGRR